MIDIQIAGAGAGKTYSLSEKIIEYSVISNKKVYAITYTNSAKKKISDTIINKIGYIPKNVVIETVHSFLLNEIIYPYSQYILGNYYNIAVSYNLPSEDRFKNSRLKKLKEKNIIHNEKVFSEARKIIDKTHSHHSNKTKKQKVDKIISCIQSRISHIFIDEAQDLDEDALKAFEVLGNSDFYIYIIGDPKQAIKYSGEFNKFIDKVRNNKSVNLLPTNNLTKRIPNEILKISNLFCPEEQKQSNSENKKGNIFYLSNKDIDITSILSHFKKEGKLIYIEKKNDKYSTHSKNNIYLPIAIIEKLRENISENFDLNLKFIEHKIKYDLQTKTPQYIISEIYETYNIKYEKSEYAEFIQMLENNLISKNNSFLVSSIDSIKGLESDTCLFILNNALYQYLIGKNNEDNKMKNKLYVALTRSSETLIIVIDKELFPKNDIDEIISNVEKLGITEYNF